MATAALPGAAGISTLLRRKAPRHAAFAAPRPIAAVGDGGNLIWGRQLRPALLLPKLTAGEKRDVLVRPISAASTPAEGGDSAGDAKVGPVGFAAKYPALVTGFFFFMWYFLNVIFNIINKKIFNYFPYP